MKNIHMKAQHISCYRNVTDITLLCAMISAYFDYYFEKKCTSWLLICTFTIFSKTNNQETDILRIIALRNSSIPPKYSAKTIIQFQTDNPSEDSNSGMLDARIYE